MTRHTTDELHLEAVGRVDVQRNLTHREYTIRPARSTRHGVRRVSRDSEEAVPVLVEALSDPDPLVRGHAAWGLGRVGSTEARAALSDRASVESNASVLEELSAAMDA